MRRVIVLAVAMLLATAPAVWAAATVQADDIKLRFRTQIENDFEWRDNYTMDDDIDDEDNSRNGWFAESEIRLGFDGKAGNWSTHVLLEAEERWDRANEGGGTNTTDFERAWLDYDFGPFHFRAGLSEFIKLEPAGIVYSDDDPMARLHGKYNDIGWTVGWMRRADDASSSSRSEDHDVFFGNATIPIKTADFNVKVTPFVMYSHDHRGTDIVTGSDVTFKNWWFGGAIQGMVPLGLNVLAEFVYNTGEDDGAGSNTTAADGETDFRSWMGLLDIAYPVPNTPLTVEFVGVWASGDDDPTDGDAEGYGAIAQDTEIGNPNGIWLDDDIFVRANEFGGTGGLVKLTHDDRFTPAFNGAAGVAPLTAGISTKSANSTEHLDHSHPGVQFYALLIHYKATPELVITGLWNHVRTMEDVDNVSNTAGGALAGTGLDADKGELGNELALMAVWKPEKYVRVTPQISVFLPGEVVDDITGEQDNAVNFYTEFLVSF